MWTSLWQCKLNLVKNVKTSGKVKHCKNVCLFKMCGECLKFCANLHKFEENYEMWTQIRALTYQGLKRGDLWICFENVSMFLKMFAKMCEHVWKNVKMCAKV